MARRKKDETEEGITGLPIPKKNMSPKKRHEFEKKRRAARKGRGDERVGDTFSQHRMTGSRGRGSEYKLNPRVSSNEYEFREEYLINYLLDEGFAIDEKSALAIASAMSEDWKENIFEGMGLSVGASKLAGRLLSNPRTSAEQGAKNFQKNVADPVGHAVKGAARAVLGVGEKKNREMMQKRRPN